MKNWVALDANLVVLLIVGNVDPTAIARHKRLQSFERRDYTLLVQALTGFERIVCTPNVLTEVSNLLRQSSEPWTSRYGVALALFIKEIRENFVESAEAALVPTYLRLGLTDSGLFLLCREGCHLLTTDVDLADAVGRAGLQVTDFGHLRAAAF